MRSRHVAVYMFAVLLLACGEREAADPTPDSGRVDGGPSASDDAGPTVSDAGPILDDASTEPGDAGNDGGPVPVDGGPVDGGPVDGGITCELGFLCNEANPCPVDQVCYGFGGDGFCAPPAPECGGFAMTDCTGGRRCIRGGGGSLGYCATLEESYCICESARTHGITTDGCS